MLQEHNNLDAVGLIDFSFSFYLCCVVCCFNVSLYSVELCVSSIVSGGKDLTGGGCL